MTLNVLSHESDSQARARVYLSSDIQVIKGSGSSGQVSIQFSPIVREVELQARGTVESVAIVGGLLAITANLSYLLHYCHRKCFERKMKSFYHR